MDTGLKFWRIQEPQTDDGNTVGDYLITKWIGYGMSSRDGWNIYKARISTEDLVALKLIFPGILVRVYDKQNVVSTNTYDEIV